MSKLLPKVRWKKNEFGQDRLQYLEEEPIMCQHDPTVVSYIKYKYVDAPTVNSWDLNNIREDNE